MQTLSQIKSLLEARGLTPRKQYGQNFLVDHNLLRRLVDAAGVGPRDVVLEVGPGTGTLTEELLARGCSVVACEIDRGLAALLRERLGPGAAPESESAPDAAHSDRAARFTLVEGDCLQRSRLSPAPIAAIDAACHASGSTAFRLVANLPYDAATPLMIDLLVSHPRCPSMHVTIQREVAQRLGAKPGSDEYGTLSIVAQACAHVRELAVLPPECFWPRPKVTSSMVELRRRDTPLSADPAALAAFCTRLFSARRKQLGTTLKGRVRRWPPGIDPAARVETLPIEALEALRLAANAEPGDDARA